MMLRDLYNIAGSGFLKERGPLLWVKALRLKHRYKILITEILLRAVFLDMMFIFLRTLFIHVARVPFVAESRHAVHAPMDKDSEFGLLVPFRHRISRERLPVVFVRALRDHRLNPVKVLLHIVHTVILHSYRSSIRSSWQSRRISSGHTAACTSPIWARFKSSIQSLD